MSSQIPKTMKAIRVEETGGPEVLKMREIPVPTPAEDEVLIKVEWTGVNFIDNYKRSGLYPIPLPFTLGQDAVGTVVHVPAHMDKWDLPALKVGDRVVTTKGPSYAEYLAATWWKCVPLQESISGPEGVALATSAYTAMYLVKESYELKKGDWALVRAAAGAAGLALIQLCKLYGANVIGTTSSAEKAKLVTDFGADHVLLTTDDAEANVQKIMEITGGKGVHVSYDSVGKDTWDENFKIVRTKGSIVTFGNSSGPPPAFPPSKLQPKSLKVTRPVMDHFISNPEDIAKYTKWVYDAYDRGHLKTVIEKEYKFTAEDIAQAHRDIMSRSTKGKLIIHVS